MRILRNERGFTLIELVLIIVVLGILAAVAIPRYVALQSDARAGAVRGMEGALRSAASMTYARAVLSNQTGAAGSVTIEGQPINTAYGYPTNADIDNAINSFSGFLFTAGVSPTASTFDVDSDNNNIADPATPATCRATYNQPTVANTPPTITAPTSACS